MDIGFRYIHRDIESTLKRLVTLFPAVALTGPRQSGKSTLLQNLFGKTHTIVSFDDPLVRERALSDPALFFDTAGEYLVLDEIQYVPQITSYLKVLIDKKRNKKGRYILTGSQQFNLIKDLGNSLAGRIALLDLLPFSVTEKKQISHLRSKFNTPREKFVHACLRGSYPEIITTMHSKVKHWYGSYFQTYLERDVRTLYDIGSLREFQKFLQLLAARCSQLLNLSGFSSDLGVSVNTVKKWLSILEASEIITILPPYYQNFGKRVTKNPKVYFLDVGLVSYLTGIETEKHLLNSPMSGALFENFVIQETMKAFYNKGERPKIYFLRTHNQLEVDLIIEKGLDLFPFEIKLSQIPNARMAKSLEAMKDLFPQLNVRGGSVLSLSEESFSLTKTVSALDIDSYLDFIRKLKT